MILKTLIILTFLCTFGYTRNRFNNEGFVEYFIRSAKNYPICICQGGSCRQNTTRAEEICTTYKKRAMKYVHPNPYFFICQVYGGYCLKAKKEPSEMGIHIFGDAYLSELLYGRELHRDVASRIFILTGDYPNPFLSRAPHRYGRYNGSIGFPVNFEGILKIEKEDTPMLKYCVSDKCINLMYNFCREFERLLRTRRNRLMDVYIGCQVLGVDPVGDEYRISWSMYFGHTDMIKRGIAKTREQLQSRVDQISSNHKHSSLKNYTMTGIYPMDNCEVRATAKTIQRWDGQMPFPPSEVYRKGAKQYRKWLAQQFQYGGKHCIEHMTKFRLEKSGGYAKVNMVLWVSRKCASIYGLTDCRDVVTHLDKRWRKGDKKWHNPFTPEYKFEYVAALLPLP